MRITHLATCGFEAARRLSQADGPASRPHGHSFFVTAESTELGLATLRQRLNDVCAPLDYRDLNSLLPEPDDLALVTGIADRLRAPARLTLRSAPSRGIELDTDGSAQRWLSTGFEAAHQLPHVPHGHQCGRLHGHGFGVRLVADALACSDAELAAAWQPLFNQLQHRYLNELPGLANPTSEVLSDWLWQRLGDTLPAISAVEVFETATAGSRRDAAGYTIWKEQRFEAAKPFDEAGRYTGHSYLVRLYLAGTPDADSGWLRDFAEVKALFAPLYRQLDHHALDTLPGIDAHDCAGIARWIAAGLHAELPELAQIDLFENEHEGARLRLGAMR
ncbi:6-carboxytetrahydropterin synthase [Crenobacter oryzisoli]|uniref:6-carboxytetrahydropterin synthase n=1 Tax=Crenobacter oryzisoli TaxID=3056844 RepID=UPI003F4938E7